jgi:hypothetical protein
MLGRKNDAGQQVAITRMSYSWDLGEAAPAFSVDYKDPENLFPIDTYFVDDDWCDLAVTRHGQPYHLARGILDGPPALTESVNGDATTRTFRLSGRGFGAVWDKTPIYFNAAIGELAELNAIQALASSNALGKGAPSTIVDGFLFYFLRQLQDSSVGVTWEFPAGIPNINKGDLFLDAVTLQADTTADQPERFAVLPGFYPDFEGNTLWDLAQEWSDPQFNEMIPSLINQRSFGRPLPNETLGVEDSAMAVLLRRRPFPWEGDTDTWFGLETVEITPQDVETKSIRKNGSERYNNFVVKTKGYASFLGVLQQVLTALINQTDIRRHGLRRFESTSNYVGSGDDNLLGVLESQRQMLRDWFGLNPYFWSGELELGRGFPEILPGYRLRLLGPSPDDQITFYVEGVEHSWSLTRGLRTTVTVTRGWKGTDQSYKTALLDLRSRFIAATAATGGA